MSVQNLIAVMRAQTVLMNELAQLEKRMLAALLDKDAAAVQACLERNNLVAEHLNQAEEIRLALIARLAAFLGITSHPESAIRPVELFDHILARLEAAERATLQTATRSFRAAAASMVNLNRALRMYTEAQLTTLDSFLSELLPQRGHGVYGADGRQTASQRPQLLSRHA
jgi:hypothetical protein